MTKRFTYQIQQVNIGHGPHSLVTRQSDQYQ